MLRDILNLMIDLEGCARSLVTAGKGLLAFDETDEAIDARFQALGLKSTPALRQAYRDLFLSCPGIEGEIAGILVREEALTYAKALHDRGIVTGVTVDTGREPMPGSPKETLTNGLIGLPERLTAFRTKSHAGFTKWRSVVRIDGDKLPTSHALVENAKRLATYAKQVQETGMVPVVEVEVLPDGNYSRLRAKAVLEDALGALIHALHDQAVDLSGVLLETSMVRSGSDSGKTDTPIEVAIDTIAALAASVPKNLLGIVFVSGGQNPDGATENLAAIAHEGKRVGVRSPVSFCFGRALTEEALTIWAGEDTNVPAAQEAFRTRLRKISQGLTA